MKAQPPSAPASARWAQGLDRWAVPDELVQRAPESPWRFNVGLFSHLADQARAEGPSYERAREALPNEGSVLDVGCGAGAASLPLTPPAGYLVGVDPQRDMLEAFSQRAEERGVVHVEIEGSWPEVADEAPPADVVVCRNVLYNVSELRAFAARLDDHARQRVVIELTAEHPLAWTAPYWKELHALERPDGPTALDAAAALQEQGLDVHLEESEASIIWATEQRDDLVGFLRRRLCLPPDRDPDIASAVERHPPPPKRTVVTLWWDP